MLRESPIFGLVLALLCAGWTSAAADTGDWGNGRKRVTRLWVSPAGSDSNLGTREAPFATIEKADSAATPGTTITVESGDYTGGIITKTNGRATAHIRFVSARKWGARIVPGKKGCGPAEDRMWTSLVLT